MIELPAEDGLAVGMVFHELATNAAKYGALSRAGGHVDVTWSGPRDGEVALTWSERGGPPVVATRRQGFGSRLIRMNIETALRGEARLNYAVTGFSAHLRFRPRSG
ncbi:MAG: sensor histidine kinase [Caulobacter sp.]|nr:sensor histidine kinase [Caulobacter sp.]